MMVEHPWLLLQWISALDSCHCTLTSSCATSASLTTSLCHQHSWLFGQSTVSSVRFCWAHGSSGDQGLKDDSLLPSKHYSLLTLAPNSGVHSTAQCGGHGSKARSQGSDTLAASPWEGFCIFNKMAHAPNLHTRSTHWPGQWCGSGSSRRSQTVHLQTSSETARHPHKGMYTHLCTHHSYTLSHTFNLIFKLLAL